MNPAILLLSAALVFIVTTSWIAIRKTRQRMRDRIRQAWGKPPEHKYRQEDIDSIASCFLNRRKGQASGFALDEITCRDLDMDDVFARLNSTETTAGEEILYKLLREPAFNPDVLTGRARLIGFFQRNRAEREAIQFALAQLGKRRFVNPTDYFFRPAPSSTSKARVYQSLSMVALASPLLLFFNTGLGALLIVLSFATNIFVYYGRRSEISADLAALSYIVRLVQCVGRLINKHLASPDLMELRSRLQSQYRSIGAIGKRGIFLLFIDSGSIADVIFEYAKILLLRELVDYEHLCKEIFEHRAELSETYDAVGLLDSAISIASFRESVPFYCVPDLKRHLRGSPKHLEFEDMYHPLIPNPVTNSLVIDQPVLVTGSNASGKSTFLKTVAINAILGQSFHTCLAHKYESLFFSVFTSMAVRDNLINGESYFIAEIKSIKRIMDYADGDIPCLCLIDEVLRGTNTIERIAASSQVLLQLAEQNCLGIAATHDIELTYILEDGYRNVHFQETIGKDGIVFDYRLRNGRATSRNAIKLLQLMGYSAAIVEEAEKRADNFISRGSWRVTR